MGLWGPESAQQQSPDAFGQIRQALQAQQMAAFGGLGGPLIGTTPFLPTIKTADDPPAEKPFYVKLKDEITDWLKIRI